MTRMLDHFDRLLSWHYGDRQKLKETVQHSLIRYQSIPNPSQRAIDRIRDYTDIIAKCDDTD